MIANILLLEGKTVTVRIWNLKTIKNEGVLCDHEKCIICLEITSDSKYIISCEKHTIIIWNFQDKTKKATLEFRIFHKRNSHNK